MFLSMFMHFHTPYIDHSNTITKTMIKFNIKNLFSQTLLLIQQIQINEIIIASIVFILIHSLRSKKHHGIPNWPIFGMLPSLILGLKTNLYEWLTNILIHQKGTFRFKGPWFTSLNCVITSKPQNLEHILKTKFTIFPKGNYFKDTVSDLLGDGIFGVDNETWQKQRKIASIEFHSSKFRKLTTDSLFELVYNRLIHVLESSVKKSVSIDLQDVLLRLTFDNVCMIAFGVDPGCLQPHLPEIPFAKAFEDATEATLLRFVAPVCVWKTMRLLNLGMERKLKNSIQKVDEFAENVIRARKKELSLENDNDLQKSDLLTVFMRLKDENGMTYSDKFLRDICVNFILAGRDTSSVALSWFFWLIDKNHEVEEKILEEIFRIVSQRKEIKKEEFDDCLRFNAEEIKKMDYLHAAISEALRLYPSVPVDHKEVVEDDTFPDGTKLKKGTKVIYSIYSMGRMESIWGKDYKEFKPERWLTKDGKFMSESAYKFSAFNGGPRLCLGKDFAYYQMKYVASNIIFHYHVKVVENHPVLPKLSLTLYMKHGLKVNLHRRGYEEICKYLKFSSN